MFSFDAFFFALLCEITLHTNAYILIILFDIGSMTKSEHAFSVTAYRDGWSSHASQRKEQCEAE